MKRGKRQSLTDDHLEAIKDYFREHGAPKATKDFQACARKVGVTMRQARLAYETRLSLELEQERIQARAKLQKASLKAQADLVRQEHETGKTLAIDDAAESAAKEAALVRHVRDSAQSLLTRLGGLGETVESLVQEVIADLDTREDLSAEKSLALLERVVRLQRMASELAKDAVETEHKRLGDPQSVHNTLVLQQAPQSAQDVESELQSAMRNFERFRMRQVSGDDEDGSVH